MELKLIGVNVPTVAIFGFNRTFMELKFGLSSSVPLATDCFNCTFMELKCRQRQQPCPPAVLIVPLWN